MVKTKVYTIDIELDFKDIITKNGKECANLVKSKAPAATGNYKEKIKSKTIGEKAYVFVETPQFRIAHLIEFGTAGLRSQRPQPHFRPAFTKQSTVFVEDMKNVEIKDKTKK